MNAILEQIGELRIVPVVAIDDVADASALGDALVAGGLPIAEVTFRTDAAAGAIAALARRSDLLVGAGTVLNPQTAAQAMDAGAQFIVSPGFNPGTVRFCVDQGIPIIPGIATPSDIEAALMHELKVVKFFPAEALGGMKMLKALAAPYGMMRFMPTGGITLENLDEYLRFAKVHAVGGSWMVARELIAGKQFAQITELSRQAVQKAQRHKA